MSAPSRVPSDFSAAYRAESVLFIPEKAKSTRTPKRVLHVICFAFLEVGLVGRVVRVRFAFDLDVSFNGGATSAVQPELARLSLVVTRFTEERPIATPALPKVSLLEPVRGLLRVPSPCPLPYTTEDDGVNVYKSVQKYACSPRADDSWPNPESLG